MNISEEMDLMIEGLEKKKLKPEYIIMGINVCTTWLIELSRGHDFKFHDVKKYNFKHRNIPVVVCESDILEVVPNAKFLLDNSF